MRAGSDEEVDREAAEWLARLNQRAVKAETLHAFDRWRRVPQHAAAYARVAKAWQASAGLAGDPDMAAAIGAALGRRAPSRRSWRPALAAALVALLAGAAVLLLTRSPSYATRVGEQRVVQLADGSTLRLNTDSRAVVRFDKARRTVELVRGQAYFAVARDPQRPFVVDAGGVEVEALGTRFDVRRERDAALVTLVEGRVEVRGRERVTLEAGEQARARPDAPPAVAPADVAVATAWTGGRVILRDMPLGKAVDEINRYSRIRVELAPDAPQDVRVSGVFDAGDTDAFVTAVTTLLPLRADRTSDAAIVLHAG